MQSNAEIKSIRRPILFTVVGFVSLFILLTLYYIAQTFIEESKQQVEQHTEQWAEYIANLSIEDIKTEQDSLLSQKLQKLQVNQSILVIDVYQHDVTNNTYSFFAGYDYLRNVRLPTDVAPSSALNQYLTPVFDGDIVKFAIPIIESEQQIGFVYLEIDSHTGLSFSNHIWLTFAVLFFFLIAAVFFISLRLENLFTSPLQELNADILKISQTKDYSRRIRSMPYKEADLLSRNINNLLTRTERHVTQLGLAEKQSLELNIELEDKVASRTAALKESNQELLSTLEKLHQFQDQLVESEKMASLGDMVAGVAHEVNTPIGLGVTASTLLSDRLKEIKLAFEDKTLKSSQLKRFLTDGEENVGIIYRNLKRAAELISSFKKVAVDQSSEDFRRFNFAELLNEILLTLAPQIKNTPYQIHFDCDKDLMVVSKPGPINQIFINLILNSITHGFDKRDHGTIELKVMRLGEQLNIIFTDDGMGIPASIKDKVFEPFTTTKRGEGGSGLGLHLVYNLVTQALGGNIKLESSSGKGTTFEINFPISEQLL